MKAMRPGSRSPSVAGGTATALGTHTTFAAGTIRCIHSAHWADTTAMHAARAEEEVHDAPASRAALLLVEVGETAACKWNTTGQRAASASAMNGRLAPEARARGGVHVQHPRGMRDTSAAKVANAAAARASFCQRVPSRWVDT
jgi:hypothetical protein